MRRFKYFTFMLFCMIMCPLVSNAECSYERQAELSRIASNVQLSYTYDKTNGFTVYVTNLTSDLYASTSSGETVIGGKEYTFNYFSGITLEFKIYSNDYSCHGEEITKKYISLPTYNYLSDSQECKQYPNFKYCQSWGSFNVTGEQFDQALNEYKNEVKSKRKIAIEKEDYLQIVLDVLRSNIFMICFLGILIVIGIVTKLMYSKKQK